MIRFRGRVKFKFCRQPKPTPDGERQQQPHVTHHARHHAVDVVGIRVYCIAELGTAWPMAAVIDTKNRRTTLSYMKSLCNQLRDHWHIMACDRLFISKCTASSHPFGTHCTFVLQVSKISASFAAKTSSLSTALCGLTAVCRESSRPTRSEPWPKESTNGECQRMGSSRLFGTTEVSCLHIPRYTSPRTGLSCVVKSTRPQPDAAVPQRLWLTTTPR